MSLPAKLSEAEIVAHLNSMSRVPFREGLATLVAAMPSPAELKEWAKKSPDRFAQAIAIFGRLAGYTERTEVFHEIRDYSKMSDAELLASVQEMDGELWQMRDEGVDVAADDSDIPLSARAPQGRA